MSALHDWGFILHVPVRIGAKAVVGAEKISATMAKANTLSSMKETVLAIAYELRQANKPSERASARKTQFFKKNPSEGTERRPNLVKQPAELWRQMLLYWFQAL
jgi:hypothetical protein